MKKTTLLLAGLLAAAPVEGARDFTKNLANYMTLGVNKVGPLIGSSGGITVALSMYKDTTATGAFEEPFDFKNGSVNAITWSTQSGGSVNLYAARVVADNYNEAIATTETTTGSWGVHAIRVNWSADPYVFTRYKNGSSAASGTSSATGGNYVHTTSTLADNIGSLTVASSGVPAATTRQIDGGIAEMAVWNKPLTDGDLVAISQGACPLKVQPQHLLAYWKLNGQGSPEIEYINKLEGTITGSIPVRDHPPVR